MKHIGKVLVSLQKCHILLFSRFMTFSIMFRAKKKLSRPATANKKNVPHPQSTQKHPEFLT
jgi:hypothetical protein